MAVGVPPGLELRTIAFEDQALVCIQQLQFGARSARLACSGRGSRSF